MDTTASASGNLGDETSSDLGSEDMEPAASVVVVDVWDRERVAAVLDTKGTLETNVVGTACPRDVHCIVAVDVGLDPGDL